MGLKVFNLVCEHQHTFEGWFPSVEALEQQAQNGLIDCPFCGTTQVQKALSVPYVNKSGAATVSTQKTVSPEQIKTFIMQELKKVIGQAEDVGGKFAEEALKMHKGEAEQRSIRGQVTHDEREQLLDEGVDILPIPDELNPDKKVH
ncbi:DUF1178 family protein [Pelistega sp. NLN82]|uniref:DUF1178 family protein n=1 Tax=Pelistega ratti TaxID=2652177 RepID=A0A6L9Y459_9BURK|nr:DUF1178 family protein [Pelistega ratti]NEN75006.1 DUF1178 family protein [Pelistega ratti]